MPNQTSPQRSNDSPRPKQIYQRHRRPKERRLARVIGVLAGAAALAASIATGVGPGTVQPADAQALAPLSGVTVADGNHSAHAQRMLDGSVGTSDSDSWENTNPWAAANYPMTAVFDLGASYDLDSLEYFVGNLTIGRELIRFEGSSDSEGDSFSPVAEISSGHQWGQWHEVSISATSIRRVRVSFSDRYDRFNVSEVHFFGQLSTGGGGSGGGGTDSMPQDAPPGPDIVRSAGFGNFPSTHLTSSCVQLHNRYWVQGPGAGTNTNPSASENKAYHTWHPAITNHPESNEVCDFGHEHGTNPQHAPGDVFDLSGGWPAFGYAADVANGHRHEDHVGHKVSVAHFRASIGNAAAPLDDPTVPGTTDGALYDAGFECDWLSKIHQGSHSLDAFANHLHEYFLTVRCLDGLNSQGVMDGQTVGTEFSVKVMYTYGKPNEFNEMNCGGGATFSASALTGPEGQSVMPAHQLLPLGNHSPNNREFSCSSAVEWQTVEGIDQVDLWTQLIKIKRPDGHAALMLQPYYIVKNPARVIEQFDSASGPSNVIRTIDVCYSDDGSRLIRPFCLGAPEAKPDWKSPDSPFNGTFRAINFKSAPVENAGGPARFCTTAFGFAVPSSGDEAVDHCGPGQILQTVAPFDNDWNNGRYSHEGHSGNVQGSIWSEAPNGDHFAAQPIGGGAYSPAGLGYEFIIDNRDPDDDLDGMSDGAHIRGEN